MKTNNSKTNSKIAIRLKHVSFSYGNNCVFRDASLTVHKNEFLSIIGKSGCGKTTLLKIISQLVKVKDIDENIETHGVIRMVFQEDRLFPWSTVYENVRLGLVNNTTTKESKSLVLKLLADVGLSDVVHRYPLQISGGQKQRAAVARALAAKPDIVLMDEPFSSLDEFTRENMQTWLLNLWEQYNATIVFVTHDVEEALLLGDRVAIINAGELELLESIDFARPREQQLRENPVFLETQRRLRIKLRESSDSVMD